MHLKRLLKAIIFSQCFITSTSFATTGGGQSIELLGYEHKEKKLFLFRHFEDASGRLPQLYYYQFNNTNKAPALIEVKSLYINPQTKQIDYYLDHKQFDREIAKIQKRLTPLIEVKDLAPAINITNQTAVQVPTWYDEHESQDQYNYRYQVKSNGFSSAVQQATAYRPELHIAQKFRIPKQNKILVTVEYFGIPIETGYNIEDPVLLIPNKATRR